MIIKKLTTEHVQDIYGVLSGCFSNPWSQETIESLLHSDNACCFGAFAEDVLVGYVALEWVLDEGSLTDLAVLPKYRRQGIAEALAVKLIEEAKHRSLQFVTLEVRTSNLPAISLYKKIGFKEVGMRPAYYNDPREDALLMTLYF